MRFLAPLSTFSLKNYRIYLSFLLGVLFGFSIYEYWLIDFMPPTSRLAILAMILASLGGALGYFFLLDSWMAPRFSRMARPLRWGYIGLSVLAGLFLLLAGTSAWRSPSKYIRFLLPRETLTISLAADQHVTDPQVVILFMKTSLGDVSYEDIVYRGWKRVGNQLILSDLSHNELTWSGRTGPESLIIFKKFTQGGLVDVSWNGRTEQVDLSSEKERKFSYKQEFEIPFYASHAMLLALAALPFIILSCAAGLLLWDKETLLRNDLKATWLPRDAKTAASASSSVDAPWTRLEEWMIFGMLVLALLLRVFNLENLNPYTDEYTHLIAARDLLHGASLASLYQRGLYVVTLPVALFFRLFGTELWAARLAGVAFNTLALIPLYLIARKINRPIAWSACFLYATSPWIIAISRNVREYAYYPFYYYWILYAMILFIAQFPDGFVVTRDWKKLRSWKTGLLAFVLFLPILYLLIDYYSTFKIILFAYAVFFLFVLGKFDLKNKSNLLLSGLTLGGILLGIYLLGAGKGNSLSDLVHPNFDSYLLRYFFKNPPQQWFFDRWFFLFSVALLGALFLSIRLYRHNFIPAFFLVLFSVSLLFFLFYFTGFRYFRLRYIFSLQLWYIVLIAIGFYGVGVFLKLIYPKGEKVLPWIVIALLITSFNSAQVLLPTFYDRSGTMPITEEYHDDVVTVNSYLLGKVQENDVLISTIYGSYVRWKDAPEFKALYYFDYTDLQAKEYIYSIVRENHSGWIVLDARRLKANKALPLETMMIDNKEVEYLGMFADQYLWKWDGNAVSLK